MLRTEDKTLNSLRILSPKPAFENQGSIITQGGLYVAKNILSSDIVTRTFVSLGITKLVSDVSVGGIIFCPELYSVNEEVIKFKRNLIPGLLKNPSVVDEKASLGTISDPWNIIFAENIKTEQIESSRIAADQTLIAGKNQLEQPSISVRPGEINISDQLNIVDPQTNTVLMKTNGYSLESYGPIYQKWDSFKGIKIDYDPNKILYITASNILLEIGDYHELEMEYDADKVPNDTKVKFYFIKKNQLAKAKYNLKITRFGNTYLFASINRVKKIKLIFTNDYVYLIT